MKRWIGALCVLLVGGAVVVVATLAPVSAQDAATVQLASKQATYTLHAGTLITDTTVNTTSAYSKTTGYGTADVFVIVDGSGTFTLTSTVQVSADGVNWADADYEYATDSTIATQTHSRSQTADGVEFMAVRLAGEYVRVKLVAEGSLIPTVQVTYRGQ